MIETMDSHEMAQAVVDATLASIHDRIAAATVSHNLSDRGEKSLDVMIDPNGQTFVQRSLSADAVSDISGRRFGIEEAWERFNGTFRHAAIEVVPSFILTDGPATSPDRPVVIISELLDLEPVRNAPTALKKDIASKLPALLVIQDDLYLKTEVLSFDLLHFVDDEKGARIVVVDVDPLVESTMGRDMDFIDGYRIGRMADVLWDVVCNEDERDTVLKSFVMGLDRVLGERLEDITSNTGRAFMDAHMLSNGVDMRSLNPLR